MVDKNENNIGIYGCELDSKGKFATVWLKDMDNEKLFEPVKVNPQFGRKLGDKLNDTILDGQDYLDSIGDYEEYIQDELNGRLVGLVSGDVVTDAKTGLSKLDWSTVDVDKMTWGVGSLEGNSVDFNAKGVYGSIASGHVRPADKGDGVIVVSSGDEVRRPIEIYADGSEFADTDLKLLVNPMEPRVLGYKSTSAIQDKIAEYGGELLAESSELSKEHNTAMVRELMEHYNQDYAQEHEFVFHEEEFYAFGEYGPKRMPLVSGSVVDIVSDVKAFAKSQNRSVDEVLGRDGSKNVFDMQLVYTTTSEDYTTEPEEVRMMSDEFAKFASEREKQRGINPVTFSNLMISEINAQTGELEIQNWSNVKVNEPTATKFAKQMKDVTEFAPLDQLDRRRPYSVKSALARAEQLELQGKEAKHVYEVDLDL